MNTPRPTCCRRCGGFTLTEVLVTIGIIVVIIGILIPVVTGVRDKARAADTASFIMSLRAAIEQYQQEWKSYPGPFSNNDIRGGAGGVAVTVVPPVGGGFDTTDFDSEDVSGTENLVLGLLGGLRYDGGNFEYQPDQVGNGPFSLNPNNPKKSAPYIENANLSWRTNAANLKTGDYDDGANPDDTIIPEFVDRFPEPMPILYLRANKGNAGLVEANNTAQYNVEHINVYTVPVGGKSIGLNKKLDDSDRVGTTAPEHGLQEVGDPDQETMDRHNPGSRTFLYPYNAGIYIHNPNMALPNGPGEGTPRQKDGFILISAGIDRVYGTADDITNFGAVAP